MSLEIKSEVPEEDVPYPEPVPASFKGRLNLAEFTFTPKPSTSRRGARDLNPNSSDIPSLAPDLCPVSKPVPIKRKSTPNLTSSPSPRKKSRSPAGYAPPSTYAHLAPLPDVLAPDLITLFVGLNPGIETSRSGHAYAHPSNLFWKLMHSSGCTTRRLHPSEDGDLPTLFSLGNTNIVSRPTRNGSELSKQEMDESVGELEEKIGLWKPESVCLVGKGIWQSIERVWVRRGKLKGQNKDFEYGWQREVKIGERDGWPGARVFVATSTSGLAATVRPEEKERIWRILGSWVEQRRRVRAGEEGGEIETEEIKIEPGKIQEII